MKSPMFMTSKGDKALRWAAAERGSGLEPFASWLSPRGPPHIGLCRFLHSAEPGQTSHVIETSSVTALLKFKPYWRIIDIQNCKVFKVYVMIWYTYILWKDSHVHHHVHLSLFLFFMRTFTFYFLSRFPFCPFIVHSALEGREPNNLRVIKACWSHGSLSSIVESCWRWKVLTSS